jgi:hypothetical protein
VTEMLAFDNWCLVKPRVLVLDERWHFFQLIRLFPKLGGDTGCKLGDMAASERPQPDPKFSQA